MNRKTNMAKPKKDKDRIIQVEYRYYNPDHAKSPDFSIYFDDCTKVGDLEASLFGLCRALVKASKEATDLEVFKRTIYRLVDEENVWNIPTDDFPRAELVDPEDEEDEDECDGENNEDGW